MCACLRVYGGGGGLRTWAHTSATNRARRNPPALTDDPEAYPHVPGGAFDEVHAAPVHALVLELDVLEEEPVLLAVHPHDRPVAQVLLRPVARVLQALAAGVEAAGEQERG